MKLRIASLLCLLAAALPAAAYTLFDASLPDSQIYPSTVHRFKVSIPDGYRGDGSETLYVGLDGILCNAPAVIDSLASAGLTPRMVGVYLDSGLVMADPIAAGVLRYNRSNEFDAPDDRFVSFLADELIPAVKAMTTPDGRPLKWNTMPGSATIFGLSSGGIASFTAAWHRPDLFGRVFSGCGTFVPMRGGDRWQMLVRKSEPRPLRIFLQDGFSDTWNPLFGSWYEANCMLASALKFAGYDINADWAEGGHSVKRASEIFADVMAWLWRDGMARITPGATANSTLGPILNGAGEWQRIENKTAIAGTCGKFAAVYPDGTHGVSLDAPGSHWLMQTLIGNNGEEYARQRFYFLESATGMPLAIGGMAFDSSGNLWTVTSEGLQILDQNGRVRGILTLPQGIDIRNSSLSVADGAVTVSSPAASFTRPVGVKAPTAGMRPESQGQG